MRDTRLSMGMPITIEVVDAGANETHLEEVFAHFMSVDEEFSTYRPESALMRINRGELREAEWSSDMREVFALASQTKEETFGYFDTTRPDGIIDLSGVVKGWAIARAAGRLRHYHFKDFYIDAGGDIHAEGRNTRGEEWSIGVRNPFNRDEILKVLYPRGSGVATSGTAVRGQHIYNPHLPGVPLTDIVSITVIGPDVCEADRFATAAFAMGRAGAAFIENLPGFEAYAIDASGHAVMTSGFEAYTKK